MYSLTCIISTLGWCHQCCILDIIYLTANLIIECCSEVESLITETCRQTTEHLREQRSLLIVRCLGVISCSIVLRLTWLYTCCSCIAVNLFIYPVESFTLLVYTSV
ncbi:Uncharacterised protein [Segatella copri]|nr:Uncharacterised protein [Segatella copri]